jgi:hypothetical protein
MRRGGGGGGSGAVVGRRTLQVSNSGSAKESDTGRLLAATPVHVTGCCVLLGLGLGPPAAAWLWLAHASEKISCVITAAAC